MGSDRKLRRRVGTPPVHIQWRSECGSGTPWAGDNHPEDAILFSFSECVVYRDRGALVQHQLSGVTDLPGTSISRPAYGFIQLYMGSQPG